MYYEDLTPYEYNSAYKGLNVGWLDGSHEFSTGRPPKGLLDAIFKAVASGKLSRCACAGFHTCEICGTKKVVFKRRGAEIIVGTSEIAVEYNGETFVAPSLIYHYVRTHKYLPPEPFVSGMLLFADAES